MKKMLFVLLLFQSSFLLSQDDENTTNKDIPIGINVTPYWDAEINPYVQINISVNAKKLYQENNAQNYLTFFTSLSKTKTEEIVDVDKIKLICPENLKPSGNTFMISQSILLASDTGDLSLNVLYGIGDKISDTLHGEFSISHISKKATLAPLRFVEKQNENPLGSRPQFGEALFYGDDDILKFYTEAYQVPEDQRAYYTYQLYSLESQKAIKGFGAANRIKNSDGKKVSSILSSLKLDGLPSGHYEIRTVLNIEKMDPTLYPKQNISFYRINTNQFEEVLNKTTFKEKWLKELSKKGNLNWYVNGLYPIANGLERRQIELLSQSDNDTSIQRFLEYFWESRNLENPLDEAISYFKVLNQVEKKYSSRAVPGYATDRGRVFLQYGAPTLTEKRPFETDGYPYEIWQYNTLEASNAPYQINRLFVFANYTVAGRNYELLHSDAIGEIKNSKWRIAIQKRSYISNDIDDEGRQDPNKFGSRINNNIFFNSGGG